MTFFDKKVYKVSLSSEHLLNTLFLFLSSLEESRLVLFGSSVSGFGFTGSDMDICLQFDAKPEKPDDVDPKDVVRSVEKVLKNEREYHKVFAIKSAKVPIVKFCVDVRCPGRKGVRAEGGMVLEGDISFYNTLAIYNSMMLSAYAMIDYRVRVLGCCLKLFAKV